MDPQGTKTAPLSSTGTHRGRPTMPPRGEILFLWDYDRKRAGSRLACQISSGSLLCVWGLVSATGPQLDPCRTSFLVLIFDVVAELTRLASFGSHV